MPTDQDPEEFIEEDEQDEIARRSIFSAGWFRALLVLTVLAIIVVVSLPYLLNWLEPNPAPPAKPQAKVGRQASGAGHGPGSHGSSTALEVRGSSAAAGKARRARHGPGANGHGSGRPSRRHGATSGGSLSDLAAGQSAPRREA